MLFPCVIVFGAAMFVPIIAEVELHDKESSVPERKQFEVENPIFDFFVSYGCNLGA